MMASTQAPQTYLDRLLADLDLIEADFLAILVDSQIRNVDPNRLSSGIVHLNAAKWGGGIQRPRTRGAKDGTAGACT